MAAGGQLSLKLRSVYFDSHTRVRVFVPLCNGRIMIPSLLGKKMVSGNEQLPALKLP